jgi:lysophospholipase L1-like esterase
MPKILKTSPINFIKWILNIAIIFYIAVLCILVLRGGSGIDFHLLGIHFKAYKISKPFFILMGISLARFVIFTERKNVLLLLISIVFAFLTAEAGLRILDPPLAKVSKLENWRVPSEILGWELIPHMKSKDIFGVPIEINSHGLRDVERSWEKAEGEYRILGLGDSFTYGSLLELEKTYLKQLESILKKEGKKVDVINAGVIGYNLFQSLTYLRERGVKYQPDLVIYFFWLDDVSSPQSSEDIKKMYSSLLESREFQDIQPSKLYLVNFLKNTLTILNSKIRFLTEAKWLRDIENRKNNFGSNIKIVTGEYDFEPFKKQLFELRDFTKNNNAHLLVVLIPDAVQLKNPSWQKINQILQEICFTNKIPFLNITPIFEKESDFNSLYNFPVDAHTTAKGARIIAETVHEKIYSEFNLLQQ